MGDAKGNVRIGVTGHMDLTDETALLVRTEIERVLRQHAGGSIVGISCLAAGADTIFAETVIDLGGQLEVVVPSLNYRKSKVRPDHATTFDSLLDQAKLVHTLSFPTASRAAYEAANRVLLDACELLVAVWDGEPPADSGGTAAVVREARSRGQSVIVIWPSGAERRSASRISPEPS